MDTNSFIEHLVKKNFIMSVSIEYLLKRIPLNFKDGAALNKNVGIKTWFALNVTLTALFEGNWMLKQQNIITLEKVVLKVKISQMPQLFLKKENGMRQKKLRTPKLVTVRVVLMRVSDFGEMKCVTGNSSSKDPFSSLITKISLSFRINFFVWGKKMTFSTFLFKNKTA